jgi:hypothetical protein
MSPMLDPKISEKYGIDPDKAAKLIADAMVKMQKPEWMRQSNGFTDALNLAAKNKSRILIFFSAREIIPECKALIQDVFNTFDFGWWVNANQLLTVWIDFRCLPWDPACTPNPYDLAIFEKYHKPSFPTTMIINWKGEECGRLENYTPGTGAQNYIAELEIKTKLHMSGGPCQ